MRSAVIFIFVILSFQKLVSAQEKDTLVEIAAPAKSGILPDHAGIQMSPSPAGLPVLSSDFSGTNESRNPAVTNINFNSSAGWKIEMMPFSGIGSINLFPFINNRIALNALSVWDMYDGSYGLRTYRVNDKLYLGTAGISDKNYNTYLQKSGYLRQINYGSSLFVGYKFSEKFSISASFTIQPNGAPLNRNQQMQNGGILP